MESKDLLLKIEALEKRLQELESQKKSSLSAFGRSYRQVGSTDSDLIIKTKGQVKIQWNNKFIDLIKDGKINADTQFIYKESSVGSKNGIYVIENENEDGDATEVWAVVGGQQINLKGKVGNTYVSFLAPQQSTPDQKYQALQNIGFFYKDVNSIDNSSLQSGIVYIESEKKLFIIEDGVLTEFTLSIPNPLTEQFVIAKSSNSKGALVIQGQGINNSLVFNNLYIYSDEGQSVFDSEDDICIKVEDKETVIISSIASQFLNKVISQSFESRDANPNFGFRLYTDNGISILEVDKLIVREGISDLPIIYPQYWLGQVDIVKNIKIKETINLLEPEEPEEPEELELELTLNQRSSFKEGDILVMYLEEELDTLVTDSEEETYTGTIIQLTPIELEVIETSSVSYTNSDEEYKTVNDVLSVRNISTLSSEQVPNLVGKYIYKVSSSDKTFSPLRIRENIVDIIQYKDIREESEKEVIKTRMGDLTEIEEAEGYGIYTDNLVVGGNSDKNFPRYTNSLKTILDSSNLTEVDSYDTVLAPIGTLKLFLRDVMEKVKELETKVSLVENNIESMKDTIYTMQQDIEALKNSSTSNK